MSNKSQTMVQKLVCLSPNFPSQEILCGLDEGWLVELVVPVLVPACRIGVLEARLPKYHISTARAKRSGASAWASAHALSMVTSYDQNIVNGYRLIIFALYSNSNPNILLGQTKLRFSCGCDNVAPVIIMQIGLSLNLCLTVYFQPNNTGFDTVGNILE